MFASQPKDPEEDWKPSNLRAVLMTKNFSINHQLYNNNFFFSLYMVFKKILKSYTF